MEGAYLRQGREEKDAEAAAARGGCRPARVIESRCCCFGNGLPGLLHASLVLSSAQVRGCFDPIGEVVRSKRDILALLLSRRFAGLQNILLGSPLSLFRVLIRGLLLAVSLWCRGRFEAVLWVGPRSQLSLPLGRPNRDHI